MIDRPEKLPRFATNDVVSVVTNVNNVVEPPESKKNAGWNFGEPPARSFFNWLHRLTYQWLLYLDDRVTNRNSVGNGSGSEIANQENVLIELSAVDRTNPANYVKAVGFRGSAAPVLNITASNVLGIGTPLADGTIPITGGTAANIILYINMQK